MYKCDHKKKIDFILNVVVIKVSEKLCYCLSGEVALVYSCLMVVVKVMGHVLGVFYADY